MTNFLKNSLSAPYFLKKLWLTTVHRLAVTSYTVITNKVNHSIKIIHLSDLHGNEFGMGNTLLLNKVRERAPDIIVITGDFFDCRRDSVPKKLIADLVTISPVYYSPGNHEFDKPGLYQEDYVPFLNAYGVNVLDNTERVVELKGNAIQISGLHNKANLQYDFKFFEAGLDILKTKQSTDYYQLLLAHMPDYFELYMKYNYDLVLCGHTHGGHIRLPFTSVGLIAPKPQYTLFPNYVYGMYSTFNKSMIVSAGLGGGSSLQNAIPRIGNPYEIVEINIIPDCPSDLPPQQSTE